jgi:hypothetical protein
MFIQSQKILPKNINSKFIYVFKQILTTKPDFLLLGVAPHDIEDMVLNAASACNYKLYADKLLFLEATIYTGCPFGQELYSTNPSSAQYYIQPGFLPKNIDPFIENDWQIFGLETINTNPFCAKIMLNSHPAMIRSNGRFTELSSATLTKSCANAFDVPSPNDPLPSEYQSIDNFCKASAANQHGTGLEYMRFRITTVNKKWLDIIKTHKENHTNPENIICTILAGASHIIPWGTSSTETPSFSLFNLLNNEYPQAKIVCIILHGCNNLSFYQIHLGANYNITDSLARIISNYTQFIPY